MEKLGLSGDESYSMRSTVNNEVLFEIAEKFRNAIKSAIVNGEIKDLSDSGFPNGWCMLASDLLQKYLHENCIETYNMSGKYGYGWDGKSHAWLEMENGTVIDITGDEYKYEELKFDIPVYVGPRDDGFHNKFELDAPVPYQENHDPKFKIRYEAVLKNL